ncbi:tagaturonate reductase [Roseateles sp. YR242]|uniref:mannitol dehydrogenase family protein n=1 Tax=Roseateles sp. YR242 TaxID=1855305 RepID=UPI0008B0E51F|nr:D-mannonate oxidoreductase [Roseateles sp. YR242]SEL85902.1 tagaturonate reductase [Roseateles sp. YR242]
MSGGFPILQFGTSRFLQAHVDLFVSEAQAWKGALGGITVVQTTANPASTERVRAMARADGFDVLVRGLVDGRPVKTRTVCRSVGEALEARTQWPLVRQRMREDVRVIVSNTGDSGWVSHQGDHAGLLAPDAAAPQGFPAKLVVLLHDRWRHRPELPPSVLPCELVSANGTRLRDLVTGIAQAWCLDQGAAEETASAGPPSERSSPAVRSRFADWLRTHVVWANSLVDRIVSEALVPVGAVAEPYALWAIERQPGLVLPCQHPAIVLTDDLARFERLKLFLLNLGHTLLADLWRNGGHPVDMTVLQAMQEPSMRDVLEAVWRDEVLPLLDAMGQGDEARTYLGTLRDRLLNPFLAHRLADIAQNHAQKLERRVAPLVALAHEQLPGLDQPRLRALLAAQA